MARELILSRQLLAMIVILACGLVPDRLSGEGLTRLRDTLKSNQFNQADIEHASVQNGLMEITVRFEATFETAEGVGAPHQVTDHWSFSRAVGAADPNWTLVATAGEAA